MAVRDALRDSVEAYERRGILVLPTLEATTEDLAQPEALYQAVYTVFRALPVRLPAGIILHVATRDCAGGDAELVWEAREAGTTQGDAPTLREAFSAGPFADLLEIALEGLADICGARADLTEESELRGANSSAVLGTSGAIVRRRYLFLLPAASRDPRGAYERDAAPDHSGG